MLDNAILLPLLAHVFFTFALMIWMGVVRVGAANRREVRIRDIALGQKAWPPRITAISNSYSSQFELPVLFYAVVILLLVTGKADGFYTNLAWLFVILRIFHVAIYTTTNNVRNRLTVFTLGALTVMTMWIVFALQILT